PEDTVSELLRCGSRRRRARATRSAWPTTTAGRWRRPRQQRLKIWRGGVRAEHVRLEHWPAAALLYHLRGKLEAVVVAILRVLRLDEHVAEDRIPHPRLHG